MKFGKSLIRVLGLLVLSGLWTGLLADNPNQVYYNKKYVQTSNDFQWTLMDEENPPTCFRLSRENIKFMVDNLESERFQLATVPFYRPDGVITIVKVPTDGGGTKNVFFASSIETCNHMITKLKDMKKDLGIK